MWNLRVVVINEYVDGSAITDNEGRKVLLNYLSNVFGDQPDSLYDFVNTYYENDVIYITKKHLSELIDEKDTLLIIGINLVVEE